MIYLALAIIVVFYGGMILANWLTKENKHGS